MKFPITIDSPEDRLARALAKELAIEGLPENLSCCIAVRIMRAIDLGHDDPMLGVQELSRVRHETDTWWVQNWPKTDTGKEAKARLKAASTQENYYDV